MQHPSFPSPPSLIEFARFDGSPSSVYIFIHYDLPRQSGRLHGAGLVSGLCRHFCRASALSGAVGTPARPPYSPVVRAYFVITGIFQMQFRAQNVGACHQATDLPPQMISMSHHCVQCQSAEICSLYITRVWFPPLQKLAVRAFVTRLRSLGRRPLQHRERRVA